MTIAYQTLETPVGLLEIFADEVGITRIVFNTATSQAIQPNEHTRRATQQLQEYIGRERKTFDLPLNPTGTRFQTEVWDQLIKLDYGQTVSYRYIAEQIGNPNACRAVGAANGRNPIGIVVPCHRVIGNNGTLTGYAGGIDRKRWLLALESGQQLDLL